MTDPAVSNVHSLVAREEALSALDDLVRSSPMLQVALEREANDDVKAHAHLWDERGHRIVKTQSPPAGERNPHRCGPAINSAAPYP